MKKKIIFLLLGLSLVKFAFAQSNTNDDNKTTNTLDFVIQFEPGVFINNYKNNLEGKIVSAPSPVIYPISIGILWPDYSFIATQPTISFYMNNHLFYDGKALPAEIENRTTTTLSFMVNIPLVLSLFINESRFQLSGGIGALLQFGFLAAGVSEYNSGYSGSAANDVSLINKYFWNDMHWFYITTGGSWLYTFKNKIKLGPTINMYIPVGTIISNQSIHGLIVSMGLKISL